MIVDVSDSPRAISRERSSSTLFRFIATLVAFLVRTGSKLKPSLGTQRFRCLDKFESRCAQFFRATVYRGQFPPPLGMRCFLRTAEAEPKRSRSRAEAEPKGWTFASKTHFSAGCVGKVGRSFRYEFCELKQRSKFDNRAARNASFPKGQQEY